LKHDLRVKAFGDCRDGKPVPTLPDRALDDLSGRFAFPAGNPFTAAYALESIAEATRMSERIDAWTHIFPKAYFERLRTMASAAGSLRRWLELKSLYDLNHRFRLMDGFAGYRQLPTPSMPPVEERS
jgi:hypothetical protein